MRELLKNWRVVLMISMLIASFLIISFNGLSFGIDFRGGTQFQIKLKEPVSSPGQMAQIVSIISSRLDWTGLKDTKVSSWGDQIIVAQMAETDESTIKLIESRLLRQGRFEATLDGNLLFSGDEIARIFKEPDKGYGFRPSEDAFMWTLPFMLKDSGASRFTELSFHKCTIASYDPETGKQYDCSKTFFFIDKPTDSVLIVPLDLYSRDKELLMAGIPLRNIPQETSIEELLLNSGIPYLVVGESLSVEQIEELRLLHPSKPVAIHPMGLNEEIASALGQEGFELKEVGLDESLPWIWGVTKAKQVISLTAEVANMEPFVTDPANAKKFNELIIRGFSPNQTEADRELTDLTILLESGSLPIPVSEISKESISPTLGSSFLQNASLMGLVALIVVSLVIFFRYRVLKLTVPIIFTGLSEVILILGFASLINWNLDLAAIAGVIAAVGTGMDAHIIVTDELMKGTEGTGASLVNRIKKAFFIIFAAAATTIATMAPVIIFGLGLGKLVGFAITTISGVLIGILITRPAYGEIAKFVLSKQSRE